MRDFFTSLYNIRDFQSRRSSSWDRTGGNKDFWVIRPGESKILLEEEGSGCIKHFYWTYIEGDILLRMNLFRGLVLRAYWDGEVSPSIEVPLGDFFGVSNGQVRSIKSMAYTTNPGSARMGLPSWGISWGFNCYLPMPFKKGTRIELENQGEVESEIWFHIDYEKYHEEMQDENIGRLHSLWYRENPTEAVQDPRINQEIKRLRRSFTIL